MLYLFLSFVIFALAAILGVVSYFYVRNNQQLDRYKDIEDAEEYQANCIKEGEAQRDKMFREAETLRQEAKRIHEELTETKQTLKKWSKALAITRPAVEAKQKADELSKTIRQLQIDHGLVIDKIQLVEAGFSERRFEFDHSEPARIKLESVQSKQKTMIKDGTACFCKTMWEVGGDAKEGERMVKEQIKLMLRAFNGESDAAINKVKFNNLQSIQKRIVRCFESLNKLGKTKQIEFAPEFLELKLDELHLEHAYAKAKEEERDRQREIQAQIREEQKAEREIEAARKKADKEERLKAKALEDAKKELAALHGQANTALEQKIALLEGELSEAINQKTRAVARAQMTKSGHVYVLSNIGTMGEGVYKIGMTRRLEPNDRVKELGDASVPFPFDVHAMIFTANAPKLENELHKRFDNLRLNLVNTRREYFRVSIDEIRQASLEIHGDAIFTEVPDAQEFWESESLRKQRKSQHVNAVVDG